MEGALTARAREVARLLERGDTVAALAATAPLLDARLLAGTAEERLAALFGRALQARAEGTREGLGNLYDLDAGPAEMLAAFDALIHHTPLVRFGHVAANLAILENAPSSLRILDIGIGFGSQWMDLLGRAEGRPVSIVGVEVPDPGPDPAAQLDRVGAALAARAHAAGVPFSFEARPARVEDLVELEPGVVVNAALALHHLADGDAVLDPARTRDAVLGRILASRPRALVLVEPDAEHNALPFAARVAEALRHYGLVLDVLANGVPETERRVIERAFFGREILNVVLGEGPGRVERHERATSWAARLGRLGWQPIDLDGIRNTSVAALDVQAPFDVVTELGALHLRWRGQAILVVSAWRAGV